MKLTTTSLCSVLLLSALACTRRQPTPPASSAPAPSASSAATAPAANKPFSCGSEVCSRDEFCEDRFKGHAVDGQGRPLQHKKCMRLPEACRTALNCECITRLVMARHCRDAEGRVYVDDYPL